MIFVDVQVHLLEDLIEQTPPDFARPVVVVGNHDNPASVVLKDVVATFASLPAVPGTLRGSRELAIPYESRRGHPAASIRQSSM